MEEEPLQGEQGIFAFPAAVRVAQVGNREELIALAKTRANDPAIFDELEPFLWAAIISNNRLDSYFTHMARSSLENFARGAAAGVSFLNSHRWMELPLGASLTGRVEELESGLVQVISDFYTLAGLQLNEVNTDHFIRGVRSGVVKDISIGFSGGTRLCDICRQNYYRCSHWAGFMYEIEENGVIRQVRATVTVEDATIHEASAVYDGATPGAVILKARSAAVDGRLRGKELDMVEQMYRVNLPVTRRFASVDVDVVSEMVGKAIADTFEGYADEPSQESQKEGRKMSFDAVLDKLKIGVGLDEAARAAALESRLSELLAAESKLATVQQELATVTQRVAELEPAAKDGEQYRSDLIDEALAEGVRAKGDGFDQEKYGDLLRSPAMTIERIKLMRDDWRAIGDARFPGGRHTREEHQPPADKDKRKTQRVPDSAYAV